MMHLPRLSLVLTLLLAPGVAPAQPCRSAACVLAFPHDAGALDVRDFGAKGDGRTDDTAAITAAVAASGADTGLKVWQDRLVFFPAGTYLVSAPIMKRYADGRFASGMALIGEGVDRTIIRLADHAPGYDTPTVPRSVVMTTSKRIDTATNRDYVHLGEGNDAYENFVENLTIDVGAGNPGAVGIDYLASNIGAIRDVLIRAPAGSGAAGLSLLRKWPGPALVQRVAVQGFDVGVDIAGSEYGVTFSQVELTGQTRAGLRNTGNAVAADALTVTETTGAPLVNASDRGLIVLAGGTLSGPAPIANAGTIVLRGVRLAQARPPVPAGTASGWLQGEQGWHKEVPGWTLPLPPTPIVDAGPVGRWIGVDGQPEGAPPVDVTARLQSAVNSGAATVYLRHGIFWISAPIELPPTLHRLIGMNSTISVVPQRPPQFVYTSGMFRITQPGPPLAIEHLTMDNTDRGVQAGIELAADRQFVLRDVFGAGVITLDRKTGGGEAYLDDTTGGPLHFAGPHEVVARQLNTEGGGIRIVNHGAPLAIVGVKTENNCTVAQSDGGARTEIIGGLLYVVVAVPQGSVPAFITQDANLAASFVEEVNFPDRRYATYLSDTQAGQKRDVLAATMPPRGNGRLVPLLWAGTPPVGQ